MTVCAYVNPHGYPTIISDLVVTPAGAKNVITPTLAGLVPGDSGPKVRLFSKTIVLKDQNTVLAFAGDEDRILEFIENFPTFYKHRDTSIRPMRAAGDIVNRFNMDLDRRPDDPNRVAICVLGFAPVVENGSLIVNTLQGFEPESLKTKNFNECFAIGSGKIEIIKQINDFDKQLSAPNRPDTEPIRKLVELLGAVNSNKLFLDSNDGPRNEWGGYLEATTISLPNGPLMRTAGWSHLRYVASETSRTRKFELFEKQFHYKRTDVGSSLFINFTPSTGDARQTIWPVRQFSSFGKESESNSPSWKDYSPDHVTVCMTIGQRNLHMTLTPQEAFEVDKIGDYKFEASANVLQSLIDRIPI